MSCVPFSFPEENDPFFVRYGITFSEDEAIQLWQKHAVPNAK
jgi:hypothetical protein